MQFEWDPNKAARVLADRDLSFADVARLFDSSHIIIASHKMGEPRWRIVGEIADVCITGVFTRRDQNIRIITARRSWPNEEREYRSIHDG
jgi:uncharacterized protein